MENSFVEHYKIVKLTRTTEKWKQLKKTPDEFMNFPHTFRI